MWQNKRAPTDKQMDKCTPPQKNPIDFFMNNVSIEISKILISIIRPQILDNTEPHHETEFCSCLLMEKLIPIIRKSNTDF